MLHNLDQLRAFVAAAECGSFSAAARRLGRAQSVVSTHMGMLEAELGLDLFERTGRAPVLTEPGRMLLEEARAILAGCGRFETLAMALCVDPAAELRLAFDEGLPYAEISLLCVELAERFPHLKVQLLHGATVEVCRWVEREDVHLGVTYDEPEPEYADSPEGPGVERQWLGHVEQVLVVAGSHPLAALDQVTERDLAAHRQIVTRFALEPGRDPHILSTSVWETNSSYAAVDLALRGIGWAIVPVNVAGYSGGADTSISVPAGLKVLDFDAGVPALRIQILWKAGRPFTAATRWLRERLRELMRH